MVTQQELEHALTELRVEQAQAFTKLLAMVDRLIDGAFVRVERELLEQVLAGRQADHNQIDHVLTTTKRLNELSQRLLGYLERSAPPPDPAPPRAGGTEGSCCVLPLAVAALTSFGES